MTFTLDIRPDPFAAVMGARRGLDSDSELARLDADALIDKLMDGDREPLLRAVVRHHKQAEHPVISRLVRAGAEDIADEVADKWCTSGLSPLELGLSCLFGEASAFSPWVVEQEHRRARNGIKRVFHLRDLRPDQTGVDSYGKVLCGIDGHLGVKDLSRVPRGHWRTPSRTRAARCLTCQGRATELGLIIPALTEPARPLPSDKWQQATRQVLTQTAETGLLAGQRSGAVKAAGAVARERVTGLLASAASEDPLPVVFYLLPVADRRHLAALDPGRLQERLSSLPWSELLDSMLDQTDRAKLIAAVQPKLTAAVASLPG